MPNTCCWRQVESYDSLDKYENFAGENVNSGLCPIYVGGKQTPGADTMDCLGLSHLPWFCDPFKRLLFIATFLCVCQMTVFLRKLVRRKWRLPASFSWFWLSPSISRWRQARSQYKHFDGERKSDLCSACLRLAECVNSLLSWHFSPTSIEAWIPPMIIKIFQVFIEFFEFFCPLSFFFNSSLCSKTSCFQSHKIPRLLAKLSAL